MARFDGREPDQLRELEIKAGVLKKANGSAYVRMGNTIALAAVYGPKAVLPKHFQDPEQAYIKCRYNMAPFSVKDRKRPGPDRRSVEISKVMKEAFEPAIFMADFARAGIEIYVEIIQGDAGTRCAGINAASVALADAGVPMRDLVCAVAAGKVGDEYALDLTYDEEEVTHADVPVAYMPNARQVTLLQMDGNLAPEDVKNVLHLALRGCERIYEAQKKALKEKYSGALNGD